MNGSLKSKKTFQIFTLHLLCSSKCKLYQENAPTVYQINLNVFFKNSPVVQKKIKNAKSYMK